MWLLSEGCCILCSQPQNVTTCSTLAKFPGEDRTSQAPGNWRVPALRLATAAQRPALSSTGAQRTQHCAGSEACCRFPDLKISTFGQSAILHKRSTERIVPSPLPRSLSLRKWSLEPKHRISACREELVRMAWHPLMFTTSNTRRAIQVCKKLMLGAAFCEDSEYW